jgi:beta-fructofuranosidase
MTDAGTLWTRVERDPLVARFRASRSALAADRDRPLYHFTSPEGRLNDPNGLAFWHGRWHLFYQTPPPGESGWHWGHTVSEDLVHWKDLPYAITPGPEQGSWSGSTLVEDDRVIAMYHGHQAGNMVAASSDPLLLDWRKLTGQTVLPIITPIWGKHRRRAGMDRDFPEGAVNTVYDPCIWKEGAFYYSLSGGSVLHPGGRRVRQEFLYRSRDLASWEYLHPFVEGDIFGLPGDDGACPYFWPIGSRHMLLHFSHMSGSKYLIGDYDTRANLFSATAGGCFTFGSFRPGGLHAPSATPDGRGGLVAMFNLNAGKPTPGWDQIMSLPRRLTLTGRDELGVEPAGGIATLRGEHVAVDSIVLPANRDVVIDRVRGNALEISLVLEPKNAAMVELLVLRSPGGEEQTRIAFYPRRGYRSWERHDGWERWIETSDSLISVDTSRSSQLPDVECRAPETAPVWVAPDEPLELRVFVDRSVVEVFVNGRQAVAVRVYPGRDDSTGVAVRAQGQDARLVSLDAWQMRGIDQE